MPAIAHLGVGFAAKRFAPKVPVIYLILAAEFIEIVFFAFVLSALESTEIVKSEIRNSSVYRKKRECSLSLPLSLCFGSPTRNRT